ncbi:hypothetical protein [Collimonas fungivorans]|uniref:hypothetical protein n=1 Tax=Collimonas fungivorans TaxID=158899 RepID=UPI0005A26896|nr:hypothetical protein [Collimonas fungivorans]
MWFLVAASQLRMITQMYMDGEMTAEFNYNDVQFLLKLGKAEAKELRRKMKSLTDASRRALLREREIE